ncbi:hypothetical protein C0J52_08867 [Blattella germanica]|nr:hypothetical protein C0J52_08867 [Blattella germanica]
MTEQLGQRYCIKVCRKLGDIQAETIKKIQQSFGDDTMSTSWIRLLAMEQRQLHVEIAQHMLDNANRDPNFLTGDEIWVYGYDPETKLQSSQWQHSISPRPKKEKARQVRSNVNTTMVWCIMSTYNRAKLSQRSTTKRSFVAFVMLCDASNRICGQP